MTDAAIYRAVIVALGPFDWLYPEELEYLAARLVDEISRLNQTQEGNSK